MREVGIMGGAFNPLHNLHLLVGQLASEQFSLEKVLFVPSGVPPHKKDGLLPKEVRFEMTAAGVKSNPLFEASRIEVDRQGPTWSIDTLYELKQRFGSGVRLNFIIGEDNLKTFRKYDRRNEFFSLARLLVCPRASESTRWQRLAWSLLLPKADIAWIACPAFPVSSTLVRDRVAEGRSVEYLVPPAINELILRRGYYRK